MGEIDARVDAAVGVEGGDLSIELGDDFLDTRDFQARYANVVHEKASLFGVQFHYD